jgi:hypothetical protein
MQHVVRLIVIASLLNGCVYGTTRDTIRTTATIDGIAGVVGGCLIAMGKNTIEGEPYWDVPRDQVRNGLIVSGVGATMIIGALAGLMINGVQWSQLPD